MWLQYIRDNSSADSRLVIAEDSLDKGLYHHYLVQDVRAEPRFKILLDGYLYLNANPV
jgi:hypothetical protein